MRDKLLNYAHEINSGKNIIEILNDLKNVFNKEEMYHEEGGCIEKIFNITKDPELLKDIGDIFLYKVRNRNIANIAYNKYLYYKDPDFYYNYTSNLKALGYNYTFFDNTEEDPIGVDLCDRFCLIAYIIKYFYQINDIDGVLLAAQCLSEAKSKIIEFKITNNIDSETFEQDVCNTELHLSAILSNNDERIDINQFAILLNPKNQNPYFNILNLCIINEKYEEALKFYNETYCKNFNLSSINNIKNLLWKISDHYRDIGRYYDAIRYQKFVLEKELNEEMSSNA